MTEEEVPALPTLAELERCQMCGRQFRYSKDDHGRTVATVKAACGHENTIRVDPTKVVQPVVAIHPDMEALRAEAVEEVMRLVVANDLPDQPAEEVTTSLMEAFTEMVRDDQLEEDQAALTSRLHDRMKQNPKLSGSASQIANYGVKLAPTLITVARFALGV